MTADHRRATRLDLAARELPAVLLWTGVLVVIMTLLTLMTRPEEGFAYHAGDFVVGLVLVVAGMILRKAAIPMSAMPAIFAALITVLVLTLLAEIWLSPSTVSMAYVLLVMCGFGPATLAWREFTGAAAVMLVAATLVARHWAGELWLDWMLLGITAVAIGALMLGARLRSIDALADAYMQIQQIATTDDLTGLLNRRGLSVQIESLAANAIRIGQLMFVVFIDIDGLKQANDEFGHDFGDSVITAVSRSVVDTVRQGDLIARWGGDELVVVGLGSAPDERALSGRLHANIVTSGVDLARWPGSVSFGLAYGNPALGLDELISRADADMYARRETR